MKDKKKISFSCRVRPLVSEEKNKYLAKASLEELKAFLPQVDANINFDVLPVAFDSCNINRFNANDDGIDTETALAIAETFVYKPINIEHNHAFVRGVILNYGFSEFGTSLPLTKEEVKNYKKPFNLSLGGILWRSIDNDFSAAVEESSDPNSQFYQKISASWEVYFDDYDIISIKGSSKNLEDGQKLSNSEKESALPKLRCEGGSGKINDNTYIYRLANKGVLFAGIGFVENPAAEVQGIATPSTEETKENKEIEAKISGGQINKEIPDLVTKWLNESAEKQFKDIINKGIPAINQLLANKSENNENKISLNPVLDVTADRFKNRTMKITNLKDITDESLKTMAASSINEFIVDELKKASTEFENKQTESVNSIKAANEKSEKLAQDALIAAKKLEAVELELASLKKDKETRDKQEKFTERMGILAAVYEFDAEDSKIVASQIKDLTDEAFTQYEKNAKTLFKEKTKEFKAKLSAVASGDVLGDALKNAKKDAALPNSSSESNLADKYKAAFGKDAFVISYK